MWEKHITSWILREVMTVFFKYNPIMPFSHNICRIVVTTNSLCLLTVFHLCYTSPFHAVHFRRRRSIAFAAPISPGQNYPTPLPFLSIYFYILYYPKNSSVLNFGYYPIRLTLIWKTVVCLLPPPLTGASREGGPMLFQGRGRQLNPIPQHTIIWYQWHFQIWSL